MSILRNLRTHLALLFDCCISILHLMLAEPQVLSAMEHIPALSSIHTGQGLTLLGQACYCGCPPSMQLYINCTAFACSAGAYVIHAKTLQRTPGYLPQNSAMPAVASEPTRSGLLQKMQLCQNRLMICHTWGVSRALSKPNRARGARPISRE